MDPDYVLALHLQRQIEAENNALPIIYSNHDRESHHGEDKQKSNLIDPTWELIDPTPNIYTLFVQFDKRFFWNKLNAVIVKWSKRMTTCAGICSYQGRAGACTVSLSEPLLKLRPRKDLIETLLHEMIHAYLFVTHNNRDRDGHGPEFHKHMYRINNEAGTKITVYHSFHDEVRLYKTHWWRCNGPCQNRKPFYGMVKRASNRAPGPNDRWWAQHQSSCNGTFIKIREPDKKSKAPGELATKSVPVTDIRKYLHNSNSNPSQIKGGVNKIHTMVDLTGKSSKPTGSVSKTTKNINKKNNSTGNQSKPTTKENIQTFKDLNNKSKTGGNALMNKGSGTIVVRGTKTDTKENENDSNPLRINNFKPFSGSGHSLTSNSRMSSPDIGNNRLVATTDNYSKDQYEAVRNFWANKYPSTTKKRPVSETAVASSSKKIKDDVVIPAVAGSSEEIKDDVARLAVPSSSKEIKDDVIIKDELPEEDVIDLCNEEDAICPVCSKVFNSTEINEHIDSCLESSFNNDFDDLEDVEISELPSSPKKQVNCLVCNKLVCETKLNEHLETCITNVFEDEILDVPKNDGTSVGENDEKIMNSIYDEIVISDSEVSKHDEEKIVACPCCPRRFKESEINAHLDNCVAL